MKKILLVLVLGPLVLGTQFYVIETPVYKFDIRAGERMKCWGDVSNDPNEFIPYGVAVDFNSPVEVDWKLVSDSNEFYHKWEFEWAPTTSQVGVHDFKITATESPILSVSPIQINKVVRITVHPEKRPPVITVGGCEILRR